MSFEFAKQFTKQSDYWSLCLPRVYKSADGFGSPSMAATALVLAIEAARQGLAAPTHLNQIAAKLLEYKMPTLFLEREFAAAALNSNSPDDLRWDEIKLPFESALLMLPKQFLINPEHGETEFIGYARFKKDEIFIPVGTKQPTKFTENTLLIFTSYGHAAEFPSVERAVNAARQPLISDVLYSAEEKFFLGDADEPFALYTTADEFDFTDLLTRFLFSVLLALTSRPAYLKRGERRGRHKKSNLPIWTPNIVGGNYRAPTELSSNADCSPKRLHWRRGHFRAQRIGIGRSETKIIWIEPILIGK
jgi:hypothetical protein